MACAIDAMARAAITFAGAEGGCRLPDGTGGTHRGSQRLADRRRVSAWTMSIAIEFLNGPRVLVLRVYAQWKVTERRSAVKNVQAHGCYRSGIPILIDRYQVAADALPDVGALRTALASSLRDSRIAVVVSAATTPPHQPGPLDGAVFTSHADALHWLTAHGD